MTANIARFERASCDKRAAPNDVGLAQFHAYESKGERPANPDAYFVRLLDGKRWWEWTVNEYASLYGTDEWPGWAQLEHDFKEDARGLKQIRQRVGVRKGHVAETANALRFS